MLNAWGEAPRAKNYDTHQTEEPRSVPVSTKIMVVDDENLIRQLLTYQLGGAGYAVRSAESGRSALERLLIEQPDLVLLDVMMPDMSGWEVCRQIRQYSDVPIIMLTAKSSDRDVVTGLTTGADDYIAKPYNLEQLLARVEAVLRRSRARRTPVAQAVGDGGGSVAAAHMHPHTPPHASGATYMPPPRYMPPLASPVPAPQPAHGNHPDSTKTVRPGVSAGDAMEASGSTPLSYVSLGRRLHEARRMQGLSLYQAELESGIRWEFLQAIERGHLNYIPRPQLRQVVQRYSSYLGVDLRELVPHQGVAAANQSAPTADAPFPVPDPPRPLTLALLTIAVLALVLLFGWLLL